MRDLFILVILLSMGASLYMHFGMRTSYSSYSTEQLDLVDGEFHRLKGYTNSDMDASHWLLERERHRRILFPCAIIAGLLAIVGVIRPRRAMASSGSGLTADEQRLLKELGDPNLALANARKKAAELLGVSPTAPACVVEAALAAQLKEREPARLEGLAPPLQLLVREQCAALVKARDLLLRDKPG